MAAGGNKGLKAGKSDPIGGCSFTLIVLGTAAWNRTFVMGTGADDNMEIITTKTSGRAGGESLAKWNRTRRLC